MLSSLNIINLPLTQNSCLCCTRWRTRNPLLLQKKKVLLATAFAFPPLFPSLLFLIFSVSLCSSCLFLYLPWKVYVPWHPPLVLEEAVSPAPAPAGTRGGMLTPWKRKVDKAMLRRETQLMPSKKPPVVHLWSRECSHLLPISAKGKTHSRGVSSNDLQNDLGTVCCPRWQWALAEPLRIE